MSTPAQVEANRRNALNSTGPRTPEGKSRSSANAIKHGLTASFRVFTNESQEDFDNLLADLTRTFAPTNPFEQILVGEIAQSHWRMARARRLESSTVDDMAAGHGSCDPDATLTVLLDNKQAGSFLVFQRYMAAAERSGYRALKQLLALRKQAAQEAREASQRNEPKSAPTPAKPTRCSEPPAPPRPRPPAPLLKFDGSNAISSA